jgi:hypothetical protein
LSAQSTRAISLDYPIQNNGYTFISHWFLSLALSSLSLTHTLRFLTGILIGISHTRRRTITHTHWITKHNQMCHSLLCAVIYPTLENLHSCSHSPWLRRDCNNHHPTFDNSNHGGPWNIKKISIII